MPCQKLMIFFSSPRFYCSDLGAHIDGFIAVVAHTFVIGSSAEKKVTGRKADVILAAHYASQAALRLLKPGTEVKFYFID